MNSLSDLYKNLYRTTQEAYPVKKKYSRTENLFGKSVENANRLHRTRNSFMLHYFMWICKRYASWRGWYKRRWKVITVLCIHVYILLRFWGHQTLLIVWWTKYIRLGSGCVHSEHACYFCCKFTWNYYLLKVYELIFRVSYPKGKTGSAARPSICPTVTRFTNRDTQLTFSLIMYFWCRYNIKY